MVPKGSQMVKNTWVDYFGPFWTTLERVQITKKGLKSNKFIVTFFGTPCLLLGKVRALLEAANELLSKMLGDWSGVDLDTPYRLL